MLIIRVLRRVEARVRGRSVYVRIIDAPPDQCIFFLDAKTKLAPVKTLTVPRLELNAAVLLARWLGRLRHILAPQLNIIDTHAWSDSTIALSWLTVSHDSFKTYVSSHRVYQVHNVLPNCQWHHIESSNNPADCASRGVMPSELAHLSLYWRGPPVIYSDTSLWEPSPTPTNICELPEARPVVCADRADDVPVEWFASFSSFDRLIRVTARILRFISHFRVFRKRNSCLFPPDNLSDSDDGRVPNLSVYLSKLELDYATRIIILESQCVHFAVLLHELLHTTRVSLRSLAKLSPFIDDSDSVIRVGGRLKNSTLTYECKHPILLAKESHLARLIGERWHRLTCNSGPRVMAALILR
uniref:Uncharacterized protein n=1 Tax=Schizaphis graminum TaxID=13262 RepID=A0A2S2PLE2_SCHGA